MFREEQRTALPLVDMSLAVASISTWSSVVPELCLVTCVRKVNVTRYRLAFAPIIPDPHSRKAAGSLPAISRSCAAVLQQ